MRLVVYESSEKCFKDFKRLRKRSKRRIKEIISSSFLFLLPPSRHTYSYYRRLKAVVQEEAEEEKSSNLIAIHKRFSQGRKEREKPKVGRREDQ